MKTGNAFCILSIDGGGLKGLIAIKILQIIKAITGRQIIQSFDLIGGTSTGGLIASAIAATDANGQCRHDLSYVENMYLEAIHSFMQHGFASGKETEKLNDLIRRTVGDQKIADTYLPVFVPTYDLNSSRIVIFKTRSAILNEAKNVKLFDVCRATSAVAPVFSSYPMRYNKKQLNCVDAGWHIKNPAIATLAEFWKHKTYYARPEITEDQVVLLSISTGNFYSTKKDWTTDITGILPSQNIATGYINEQKLELDLSRIKFMRVDLYFGNTGNSFQSLMEIGDKIDALSKDKAFAQDIRRLLAS